MSWTTTTRTTAHTCGGPTFGRKTPGCPRCDELIAGAAPVAWGTRSEPYSGSLAARRRFAHSEDLRLHFASAKHHNECGPCCTYGDY
jgi:hypothetical protein